ncbi:ZIP family metal transporter [Oleiagrimonas sp.]|jgi:zinc and cadmium transporter|uniref:ZIP family metal transporter n=1 Tax=Oleiagrimonas sp. TaxID=2010330 RepID=UPI00261206B5|nr:ZIP family metal transporter [Oleiagrimonas sp.]MDA3915101.1 ZIP family metal transporter [Oleiagrimonas sp.]
MTHSALLLAVFATLAVASVAGISAVVLRIPEPQLQRWLPWWQAAAIGLLVGDASMHMMPAALAHGLAADRLLPLTGVGIAVLFVLERLVRAQGHSHSHAPGQVRTFARMNVVGDFTHHLSDGVVIGASFAVSNTLGLIVSLAIAGHEIPRELSNAAVLIAGGQSRRKAVWWTLATTTALPAGALLTAVLAQHDGAVGTTLALASGATLYVALVDLLPPLWQRIGSSRRLAPMLGTVAGVVLMWLSTFAHPH